jgi:hypothetical protein
MIQKRWLRMAAMAFTLVIMACVASTGLVSDFVSLTRVEGCAVIPFLAAM